MTAAEKPFRSHRRRGHRLVSFVVFAALAAIAPARGDEVYSKNKLGNESYKKKNYEEALKHYDDALLLAPSDTLLKMNRGSALYRLGRVEEADSSYRSALGIADKKKRADAHYNTGNILFREGDKLAMGGGQNAMDKYKEALQHYITALDLRPDDKDAKWNLELAQRRVKQQEQRQKQQQQNKNDQDKQDKKQDKQDQNDQNKQDKQQDKQDQKDQQQDKKQNDQDKQNQNEQNDDKQKQQQQPPPPQPQQEKADMKKEEAKRLIAQFADDADSLNKPPEKKGAGLGIRKPEKDW